MTNTINKENIMKSQGLTNINIHYRNNFFAKNFKKNFCDNNKKDPPAAPPKAGGERRRIGLKSVSKEDLLKKKMESIKQKEKEEEEKKLKKSSEENDKKKKENSSSDEEDYSALIKKDQYSNKNFEKEKENLNVNVNKTKENLYNNDANNARSIDNNNNFVKEKIIIDGKDQISFDFSKNIDDNKNLNILSDPNISEEDKKIFAKILGDMKRIDAMDSFQSEKINDLIRSMNLDKNPAVVLTNKYNPTDFYLNHKIGKIK